MKIATVDEFLKKRVLPEHRPIVERLRALMRKAAPRAREIVTYGILGWKAERIVAVVSPTKKDITFAFSRGADFRDKHGLLGGVGHVSKHVKMKSTAEIDEVALKDYIGQALALDGEKRTTVKKIKGTKATPKSTAAVKKSAKVETVDGFLAALDHPMKREIEALRAIIGGADPSIAEGVKWNAPSFRTTEYFATINCRSKRGLGVVLHFGAKVRDDTKKGVAIDDPSGLLEWLSTDRAMATFTDAKDIIAKKAAFAAVIRSWIRYV